MDILHVLHVLRRWAWFLLLTALAAAVAAYLILGEVQPRYRASALLQVDAAAERAIATIDIGLSERLTLTYATLLSTRAMLDAAAAELGIAAASDLHQATVSAEALRNTQLMRVTVEDVDAFRAAALANAVGDVFARQMTEIQRTRFAEARNNLTNELHEVQLQIEATQLLLKRPPAVLDPLQSVQQEELLASYRATFAALLKSSEDIRLAELQDATSIHVVDAAVPSMTPLGPQPLFGAVLAAVAGLLLSAAVAFALEFVNDRVSDQAAIERMLRANVLAVVDDLPGRRPDDRLVSLRQIYSPAAEAYQMLRVRLEIARYGKPLRVLLVTSSNEGEGKTTTAANLAVTIARTGKRVVLIDADLRRPSLHHSFNHQNIRGLTTALHAGPEADLNPHLLSTRVDTLVLMPAGPIPADPSNMLGSPALTRLFERLLADADLLVVDSPPLLQVADSSLLLRLCDTVLLVAMAGRTRTAALLRAAELVRQTGRDIAGVVLNRASRLTYDDTFGYGYGGRTRATRSDGRPFWQRWRRVPAAEAAFAYESAVPRPRRPKSSASAGAGDGARRPLVPPESTDA